MRTITIKGIKFATGNEALQHASASGRGETILVGGHYFVVERGEAERLGRDGVPFAYLAELDMPDGTTRVVTVPVNE